jgi:DNA polymerase III delta prime subunit
VQSRINKSTKISAKLMPKAIPPVKAASDLDDEIEDKEISSSSSKQTIDKRENQVSFCND